MRPKPQQKLMLQLKHPMLLLKQLQKLKQLSKLKMQAKQAKKLMPMQQKPALALNPCNFNNVKK